MSLADRSPTSRRRSARLFGVWLLLCAGTPAGAAATSANTLSFALGLRDANGLCEASSQLALDHAAGGRVRAFARREIAGRARIQGQLEDWARAVRERERLEATRIEGLGRFLGPQDKEIVIDPHPRPSALPRLAALDGGAFDDLYVEAQTEALTNLVAIYKDYILNGDDETLRALSVHELPRVTRLLAEVRRLR